jgi:6-phosphogluconolactonase (cycloisomerase 2 family)
MGFNRWARLALAVPLFLTSCKGFWNAPASSSGSGSTTATSGNFYVLNAEKNQVAGYYVNAGNLTALAGSPYTVPTTPLAITVAPNNNFLYVSTADGIYVYTIASTGQLTLGNASGAITSDQAISMQVAPNSDWLVEIASGAPYVYAIPINSSTGVITSKTEQFAVLPASSVQQVAISPDETYVFVAMGAAGTATIPFNAANANPLGAVNRISLVNSAGAALSVAVDPLVSGQSGPRLFYVGETVATAGSNSGGLRVFDFSTLKEISGSPFATQGLAPYSILPISTGSYVYVVNRQVNGSSTGVIAGFTIAPSSSTYTLTALGSTFTVGTNPVALAEDNTGDFVFAVDYGGSPDLKGFTFDSTKAGYLDGVISASTGTDPVQAGAIAAAH